ADTDRPGFLRAADGGVLFLDEIGELSLELQARLLHVLDDGSFYPLGSDEAVKVDVVIIAATNRDLKEMEEKGSFRQDLYSRLSNFPLTMPALRNRPEDMNFVIDSSFEKWNSANHVKKSISNSARVLLQNYNWPKNIRELQQTIIRVCLLSPSEIINIEDLPQEILESTGKGLTSRIPSVLLPENGVKLRELILDIEKEYFRQAIDRSGKVMSKAAALVGWEGPAFRKAVKERYPDLLDKGKTTAFM
ncbi:MAG: sigma-54-dependent Fis family transcriptional regulator, partial [Spirochaetaceae bacterium]|nr:sigma-54-dependent Fis family transcriptional regulator [Spirochaetaceae bacterium]